MKKFLWVSGLVLAMATPAFADSNYYYAPNVTGARYRSNLRHFLYIRNLEGAKLAVYEQYGYTPYRLRLNEYGEMREKWTYYEAGKVFVFDQEGNIDEEFNINVEKRRLWQYQKDVMGYDENVPNDD